MPGGDQRQERPGAHRVQRDPGIGGHQRLGRLEEEREPGGQRVHAGQVGVQGDSFERLEEVVRVAGLPQQVHPAVTDRVEGDLPRAEPGQQLLADGPAHVPDGDGLGQHTGHLYHVVERPRACRRDQLRGRPGRCQGSARLRPGRGVGAEDAAGQPVHTGMEHEPQPDPVRIAHQVRHRFLRQHRRPVVVLVGGVAQPGEHLPRMVAEQLFQLAPQQLLAAPVGVDHPAVLVEGEQAVGQPLRGLRRGDPARRVDQGAHQRPGGPLHPHDMAPQLHRPVPRPAAVLGLVQHSEAPGPDLPGVLRLPSTRP